MSWTEIATMSCGLLAIALLIATPAALLVFVTRRRFRARVTGPDGAPVAGATVYGHGSRQYASNVYSGGVPVVDRSFEATRRRIGRTNADGVVETTLWMQNPWGVTVEADGFAPSDLRVLRVEQGVPIDVGIQLSRERPKRDSRR